MRGATILVAALMAASPAWADIDPQTARAMVGQWRLSDVGGKVACTLTLTGESILGGWQLRAPLACRRAFPPLKEVAVWASDGASGVAFTDTQKHRVVVFSAQEGGAFQAKAPDGKTWRLEPVKGPPPSHAKLNGAYRLTGAGGAALCDLNFRPDLFGASGWIDPSACAGAWQDKAFALFVFRDGRLTLMDKARKTLLVLKEGEAGAFVSVDPKAESVTLAHK